MSQPLINPDLDGFLSIYHRIQEMLEVFRFSSFTKRYDVGVHVCFLNVRKQWRNGMKMSAVGASLSVRNERIAGYGFLCRVLWLDEYCWRFQWSYCLRVHWQFEKTFSLKTKGSTIVRNVGRSAAQRHNQEDINVGRMEYSFPFLIWCLIW